jgi:hypothetical protein
MFFNHHVNDFNPTLGMVAIANISLTTQTNNPTCNISNVLVFGRFSSSFDQKLSKNKDNTLQEVEQNWQQLRGTMLAPLSSDLRAADLKPFLANNFIADKFAQGLVQVRAAGAGIKTLVGDDPCGMLLIALFSAASRAALAMTVYRTLAIFEITRMNWYSIVWNRHKQTARMLLLSMIGAQLHPSRLLGVLLPDRANAGTVTKFSIDTIRSYSLAGAATETAAEASAQPDTIQQSDRINPRQHLTQAGQAQSMRPAYLNVVP